MEMMTLAARKWAVSKAPDGGKWTQELIDRLFQLNMRQYALELLRERHQLSIFECIGTRPEVVRARQEAYERDRERLEKQWAEEDVSGKDREDPV